MGERVVKVRLSAQVAEYRKGMFEAAQATKNVGTEAEKLAQTKQAFEDVGRSAAVMGGVIGAAVTVAIAKFAEFDQAMSNVDAATGESAANMGLLRDAAIEAGASTVYSATESANAIEELAKAGVSTADILAGGLAGSLDLAAAGQLGVARAAEITSTALNQYSLDGSQAAHVADVLAAGAGKAMGSVDDLANGLKFVGPVAAAMGVSLEETTGVLALFAQQGIIGEQAGTSLRGVLSSLTSPSKEARKEIERLGLTLYDSQGNFLGLQNAAGQLSKAYTDMDGASRDASLGIIFGRETVTAATALYRAGAKGVDEWTAAVDDSGYAAEQARKRLDNLKGDIEALQGALDTALIESGSGANDVLRATVQSLTGLVDIYGELPEPVQQATLLIGGATAAILLSGGTALAAVPKFLEMQATIRAAGLSMGGLSLAAGGAGLAIAGLFAVIGELARTQAEAKQNAESYASTLEEGTNRITQSTRNLLVENLAASKQVLWWQQDSALENARTLGVGLDVVRDAVLGDVEALKKLDAQTNIANKTYEERVKMANALGISELDLEIASGQLRDAVRGESSSIEEATRVNERKAEANRELAGTTEEAGSQAKTAAGKYIEEATALDDVSSELEQLIEQINKANGIGQDAISANLNYQNALADVDEQIRKAREGVEGYGITLDTGTQQGRDNMAMLVDLAQRAEEAAAKQYELDGNTLAYKETLESTRQALIDRATALGMNEEQARSLADQILRIPSDTEWKVIAETNRARSELDGFISTYNGRQIRLDVATDSLDPTSIRQNANGGLYDYAFANGGGVDTGIYAGRAGAIHRFAEPETVWEAYVSGKPSQRERNVGIWQETGRRLGVEQGPTKVTNFSPTYNVPQGPTADQLLRAAREDAAFQAREAR